jgi:hypothetical protein
MVRRVAEVVALGIAIAWLALPSAKRAEGGAPAPEDALADAFASSPRMREFLHGTAIAQPLVGPICRLLVMRLSVYAKTRERSSWQDRSCALRLDAPIDQRALRNLLIWQNHVLSAGLRDDAQVDIALVLASGSSSEARLFDLFSAALMLERVRSFSVFWDEEIAIDATSVVMSQRELSRRGICDRTTDLGNMPRAVMRQVALQGTRGGVKLLQHGRKYANDFLKLTLPGRFVVAIGLQERADGTVEPRELELWPGLLDKLHARHPGIAFVVLNCLTPSQWREWPSHLRFARHQGLTLQDTICLAQIADGYLGVLDLLGLAAHSAGRPGVYIPLDDGEPSRPESAGENSQTSQIMVGSMDRAEIEAALETFGGFPPFRRVGLS